MRVEVDGDTGPPCEEKQFTGVGRIFQVEGEVGPHTEGLSPGLAADKEKSVRMSGIPLETNGQHPLTKCGAGGLRLFLGLDDDVPPRQRAECAVYRLDVGDAGPDSVSLSEIERPVQEGQDAGVLKAILLRTIPQEVALCRAQASDGPGEHLQLLVESIQARVTTGREAWLSRRRPIASRRSPLAAVQEATSVPSCRRCSAP